LKPTLLLRIASVVTFIHCLLHTVAGVFGSPKHGAEEFAVIEAMQSHHFDVMGSMRSYWDFHFGYGLFVTIGLLTQAVLFWQLAAFAKTNSVWTKPIVALFFFSFIGMAIISWRYFFLGPAVTELLIAACLGAAFVTSSPAGNRASEGT